MKNVSIVFLVLFLIPQIVLARPEYALREKAACLNCHVNPFGGGHRNQFGKMYGSRKIGSPLTNDYRAFYGDFRMIFKRDSDTSPTNGNNGFALMSSEVSGNVILTEEETGFNTSATASIDLGSLGFGPRNAYVLFTNTDKKAFVHTILVGKSYIPFGYLTDDHRSYLRMHTRTEYNTDFEMGATISGTPLWNIHYDLTLMNGSTIPGGKFISGDERFGYNVNVNWNPADFPFLVGASHLKHFSKLKVDFQNPYAYSAYGIVDFREPTEDLIPVSIIGEMTLANHFNNKNIAPHIGRFINETTHPETYERVKNNSMSRGISAQVKWDVNKQWQLALRHENFVLDKDFPGDGFNRETAAVTYQFTANSSILGTFEKADAKNKSFNANGRLFADTDTYFLLFRTWL